jgi:NADH-quinone oxidoreductase subunit H
MSPFAVYWNRLSTPSRVTFVAIPTLLLLGGLATLAMALLAPPFFEFVGANPGLVRFVVAVTAIVAITVPTAFLIIYLELKIIARMNLRVGPDRVGPFGVAQSVIHGLKVLVKEDYTPLGVDVPVFTFAPVVTFLATIMGLLVIPFAPGLFAQDFSVAVLYFFAVGGFNIVGLMMAGWASFNKYSLIGALRAAAQAISYEVPLALAAIGVVIIAGTMSLNSIVEQQAGSFLDWNVLKQPLGFIIFFIAAIAETNRTPFDMTEADQEIVAGFATEYSGMRFGFFFFAEYVNIFVISAFTVVLFFGGWNAPFSWPFPIELTLDPAALGINLLFLLILGPLVGTILLAAPFWLASSRISAPKALAIGFVLFNILAVVGLAGWALVSLEWVSSLFWMLVKTYAFVFIFVWMRATLPRVRADQLMAFAWKWLVPLAILNMFVTASALLLADQIRAAA